MRAIDIKELASTYETSVSYVRYLLHGGIPEGQLQDVLDIRESTVTVGSVVSHAGNVRGSRTIAITAKQLVELYRMADGDLDLMAEAVERAREDFYSQKYIVKGLESAFSRVLATGLGGAYECHDE